MELTLPPEYNSINDVYTNTRLSKRDKLVYLINKYEIDPYFSEKLEILNDYEIVLLCDDSGSMNTPLNDNNGYSTRWDELKAVVNIVVSIATIYDNNGIDIHFLNREGIDNIKCEEEVKNILNEIPCGGTPLTQKLEEILQKFNSISKKLLVIIATDGLPTYNGQLDLENFKTLLKNKNHSKVFISFLACSDNSQDVDYLNELDKTIPNIDTLDDYNSELKEVRQIQGNSFKYSFSDHIVRLLLGPICPELDKLDEKKINKTKNKCNIM